MSRKGWNWSLISWQPGNTFFYSNLCKLQNKLLVIFPSNRQHYLLTFWFSWNSVSFWNCEFMTLFQLAGRDLSLPPQLKIWNCWLSLGAEPDLITQDKICLTLTERSYAGVQWSWESCWFPETSSHSYIFFLPSLNLRSSKCLSICKDKIYLQLSFCSLKSLLNFYFLLPIPYLNVEFKVEDLLIEQ